MLEKGKISGIALVFTLVHLVVSTGIISLPALAVKFAGQDAWLVSAIATLPGIVIVILVAELGRRFPGKTIIEYLQIILGKWPGKAIGVFYLFFFIHTNSIVIRQFGELIVTTIMMRTPIVVFHVVMVLLAAYMIKSGLEVVARISVLTLPWVFGLHMLFLTFGLQRAEVKNLLPILENGIQPLLLGSITPTAWRGEAVLLAMLLPYLAAPQKGKMLGVLSVICLGAILMADTAVNVAVFGLPAARMVYPTALLASEVLVGGFLRVDVVLVITLVAGVLIKIVVFYYASVLGAAQLLDLKDYRPLVVPIGVILVALSILSIENSVAILTYVTSGFPSFAYLFEWVIPLILLLIAVARNFKPKY